MTHHRKNGERHVTSDVRGKKAKTNVKLINQYKKFALIQCQPITGRTHQLRVHLCEIGYPIYGDKKYKSFSSTKRLNKDLMLHSYQIKFMINDKKYTYKALLPDHFKKLLKIKRLNFSNS